MNTQNRQQGMALLWLIIVVAVAATLLFALLMTLSPKPHLSQPPMITAPDPVIEFNAVDQESQLPAIAEQQFARLPAPSPAATPTTTSPGAEQHNEREQRQARLLEVSARLAALGSRPDPLLLDAILADVQQLQADSGIAATIDLSVVRKNLMIADQIRQVAEEMQTYSGDPEMVSSDRFQADIERLTALQSQLSADIAKPVEAPE